MVLPFLFAVHIIEEIFLFRFTTLCRYVSIELPFLLIEKGFPVDTRPVLFIRNENTRVGMVMTGDRHR
jgi:hypothetical protein